jgi:hypothetical protein
MSVSRSSMLSDATLPISVCTFFMLLAAAGCATQPAPEFGGRWRAVNRFDESPQEIPLYQAYEFYAAPLDGTLKNMLTRWAQDSRMTLSYSAPTDYTLHAPVAAIRTRDLSEAVALLNSAYAWQSVAVSVEDNKIVVRQTRTVEAITAKP